MLQRVQGSRTGKAVTWGLSSRIFFYPQGNAETQYNIKFSRSFRLRFAGPSALVGPHSETTKPSLGTSLSDYSGRLLVILCGPFSPVHFIDVRLRPGRDPDGADLITISGFFENLLQE